MSEKTIPLLIWHHAGSHYSHYRHYSHYSDHHHYVHSTHAMGWLGHSVLSAIIHGVIYNVIWRYMDRFSLTGDIGIAVGAIALVGLVYWFFSHI